MNSLMPSSFVLSYARTQGRICTIEYEEGTDLEIAFGDEDCAQGGGYSGMECS